MNSTPIHETVSRRTDGRYAAAGPFPPVRDALDALYVHFNGPFELIDEQVVVEARRLGNAYFDLAEPKGALPDYSTEPARIAYTFTNQFATTAHTALDPTRPLQVTSIGGGPSLTPSAFSTMARPFRRSESSAVTGSFPLGHP